MGDNFETIMTSYFEDFKKSMKQRLRISVSLIEQHIKDIFFLVDIDYTYILIATSRQPIEKTSIDTSTKVDSTVKVLMIEHKTQSTK